jgi:hypothetical protein
MNSGTVIIGTSFVAHERVPRITYKSVVQLLYFQLSHMFLGMIYVWK